MTGQEIYTDKKGKKTGGNTTVVTHDVGEKNSGETKDKCNLSLLL